MIEPTSPESPIIYLGATSVFEAPLEFFLLSTELTGNIEFANDITIVICGDGCFSAATLIGHGNRFKIINGSTFEQTFKNVTFTGSFIFNPELFGAVGDGVTDDTIAIQNCIDVACETGVRHVEFLPRKYRITSTILLQDSINLQGSSYGSKYDYKKDAYAYIPEASIFADIPQPENSVYANLSQLATNNMLAIKCCPQVGVENVQVIIKDLMVYTPTPSDTTTSSDTATPLFTTCIYASGCDTVCLSGVIVREFSLGIAVFDCENINITRSQIWTHQFGIVADGISHLLLCAADFSRTTEGPKDCYKDVFDTVIMPILMSVNDPNIAAFRETYYSLEDVSSYKNKFTVGMLLLNTTAIVKGSISEFYSILCLLYGARENEIDFRFDELYLETSYLTTSILALRGSILIDGMVGTIKADNPADWMDYVCASTGVTLVMHDPRAADMFCGISDPVDSSKQMSTPYHILSYDKALKTSSNQFRYNHKCLFDIEIGDTIFVANSIEYTTLIPGHRVSQYNLGNYCFSPISLSEAFRRISYDPRYKSVKNIIMREDVTIDQEGLQLITDHCIALFAKISNQTRKKLTINAPIRLSGELMISNIEIEMNSSLITAHQEECCCEPHTSLQFTNVNISNRSNLEGSDRLYYLIDNKEEHYRRQMLISLSLQSNCRYTLTPDVDCNLFVRTSQDIHNPNRELVVVDNQIITQQN